MRGAASFLAFVDRLSERTGLWLSLFLPAMVLVIGFEVAARYFFSSPTIWAYDTALLLYAWLGMLGGAYAMKRNAHIRVDILSSRLPPRGQAALELITFPLMAFFLALVIWQVGAAALDAWHTGSRRPTEWAPPMILFLAAAPVGAMLILLQLTAGAIRAYAVLVGLETAK